MLKKKFGVGTISLFLSIIGVAWAVTLKGVCIGDSILNYLGYRAWSNGSTGTHFTAYYSLLIFIPAFLVAMKYSDDLGAKAGKILSFVVGTFIVISVFGLAL